MSMHQKLRHRTVAQQAVAVGDEDVYEMPDLHDAGHHLALLPPFPCPQPAQDPHQAMGQTLQQRFVADQQEAGQEKDKASGKR